MIVGTVGTDRLEPDRKRLHQAFGPSGLASCCLLFAPELRGRDIAPSRRHSRDSTGMLVLIIVSHARRWGQSLSFSHSSTDSDSNIFPSVTARETLVEAVRAAVAAMEATPISAPSISFPLCAPCIPTIPYLITTYTGPLAIPDALSQENYPHYTLYIPDIFPTENIKLPSLQSVRLNFELLILGVQANSTTNANPSYTSVICLV